MRASLRARRGGKTETGKEKQRKNGKNEKWKEGNKLKNKKTSRQLQWPNSAEALRLLGFLGG